MKTKKKIFLSILFLIVYCIIKTVFGSWKLKHFFDEFIIMLILLGIITLFMMLIPIIFKIFDKKKNKNWKLICGLNGLIITLILIINPIITLIKYEPTVVTSMDPIGFSKSLIVVFIIMGIIYYFINYILFSYDTKMEKNKESYYQLTNGAKPHSNVIKFLELNLPSKKAIDLGCGAGRDTIALIKNGWEVLAIDKEDTEHIIRENLTQEESEKLKFKQSLFGEMELPKSNLIIANFSLPFSKKENFKFIWEKIVDSLGIDRIFCRKFFWKKRFMGQFKRQYNFSY